MQTLGLLLRSKSKEGTPLPGVFKQLEDLGAKVRRGQVTLIGAAPGGGKSALATFLALKMQYPDGSRVPTIYFSADSDRGTFGSRAMSSALEMHVREAEKLIAERDEDTLKSLDKLTNHMWLDFNAAPTPRDIDEEVEAFAHSYGDYPHLIVIDNLMDVASGGDGDLYGHDAVLDFAKQLGRRTGAAVVVLCHVTGAFTDGTIPIPRSGLMNKIDKRPRLIMTLYQEDTNLLGICVVKNSNGIADATAGDTRPECVVFVPWVPEKGWMGRGE